MDNEFISIRYGTPEKYDSNGTLRFLVIPPQTIIERGLPRQHFFIQDADRQAILMKRAEGDVSVVFGVEDCTRSGSYRHEHVGLRLFREGALLYALGIQDLGLEKGERIGIMNGTGLNLKEALKNLHSQIDKFAYQLPALGKKISEWEECTGGGNPRYNETMKAVFGRKARLAELNGLISCPEHVEWGLEDERGITKLEKLNESRLLVQSRNPDMIA